MMAPSRDNRPAALSTSRAKCSGFFSPVCNMNPMRGCAIAKRRTVSVIAITSARSDFMNLSRAGVAENKSRTQIAVPPLMAAGFMSCLAPRTTLNEYPAAAPRSFDVISRCAIEPTEASASPRNPRLRISNRSSSDSFEVAWRSTDNSRSGGLMPLPSSATRMSDSPPPATTISMSRASASMAFSTSSFTTLAGRSITSPAAMRLTVSAES